MGLAPTGSTPWSPHPARRFVGTTIEGNLIVENGLLEGERIIVHGINKVYHGSLADPVTLEAYEAELTAEQEARIRDEPQQAAEEAEDESE